MVGNCAYIDPDGKLDVKNVGNQIAWLQEQGFVDKGFAADAIIAKEYVKAGLMRTMDLIADHISHRFGALEVLDDVSFTVGSGEVVAIVGPSGCGKSTLLSILGGLLQPSAGAAELRGAPPPDSLNPLTFVFQDFALLPWCTVEENVEFPLAAYRLVRSRAPRHGRRRACAAPASPIFAAPIRSNCPAACASASASPARSRCGRRSC